MYLSDEILARGKHQITQITIGLIGMLKTVEQRTTHQCYAPINFRDIGMALHTLYGHWQMQMYLISRLPVALNSNIRAWCQRATPRRIPHLQGGAWRAPGRNPKRMVELPCSLQSHINISTPVITHTRNKSHPFTTTK